MKKLILLAFLLPVICFAASFQAILFDTDAEALAFVITLESRIPHDPSWTYVDHASPTVHLDSGKKALVIVDRIKVYLTPEELARVETINP